MAFAVGPSYITSVRDRTAEFHTALSKYGTHAPAAPSTQRLTSAHAQFSQRAHAVARDLTATTAKLDRLSQLARRKTLFDDRPVEISELTYIIKHDIAGLNRQLAELQQLSGHAHRGSKNRADEHRSNVVTMLQSTLATTTTSFQEILEVRTQNMKASKDRSEQFFQGAAPVLSEQRSKSPLYTLARAPQGAAAPGPGAAARTAATPPASALTHRNPSSAQILPDEESRSTDKGFLALDMMESGAMQQQQLMLNEFEDQQSNYLQQRSNAIESIESTISELGQIFGQLAHMVAQQGEMVQRIDDDVLQVSDNVEGARRELLKYYATISNNRWLMLKIFGVLIVFFLLFILIS
ncbi:Integral membrane protein SED5 [Malassezia caprae]|uniref:Integral membrane protein SED5 n=1 Tax=Malassezia caprae TaxID=1381934 RepID=A0AAF0E6G3_9BASI|nr:Integral membrane protein SED5 [Malassezia caprae]